MIGCDPIVAAAKASLAVMRAGRTYVALNTHATPTAAFVSDPDWQFPAGQCESLVLEAVGPDHIGKLDADALAVQLLGDSIYTNPLMLGYAWQQGKVPLSHAALMRAIELNGVQIENNKAAFEWGRRAAAEPKEVKALVRTGQVIELVKRSTNLDDMIAKRVEFLTDYQNAAYADAVQALRRHGAGQGSRAGVLAHRDPARRDPAEHQAHRGGGPLPVQADGLQGRVRGGAPAQRPPLPRQGRVAVRGQDGHGLPARLPPRAAGDRQAQRQGRAAEAASSGRGCCRRFASSRG